MTRDDGAAAETAALAAGLDLPARALAALRDEGFLPEVSPDAAKQLAAVPVRPPDAADLADLRDLLWSSIDNPDSRDLDQVEWAEPLADGAIRLRVGIADVDALVPAWTPLDAHAARSTTSIYTGVATFPMLPERLSTDLTSLNEGEDRVALVAEMIVAPDGAVGDGRVFRAWLRNRARLVYEEVGPWLEGRADPPARVADDPALREQLRLQDEAARRLAARRRRRGALDLETIEPRPVLGPNGRVLGLEVPPRNRAHHLIEDLMIAANGVVARFLEGKGVAGLQRVVLPPERWPRIVALAAEHGEYLPDEADSRALAAFLEKRRTADPLRFPDLSLAVVKLLGPGEYRAVRPGEHLGHFGLATAVYTHATAPNRRYPDLVTQRQVKAALAGARPPYDANDLDVLAAHCTEREDASRKVERLMRKVVAAVLLSDRIGDTYEATVTGVSRRKGTFARVLSPPVEGRIVAGEAGLDVGDLVSVRLVATDPVRGHIDFARLFSGGRGR